MHKIRITCPECGEEAKLIRRTKTAHTWSCRNWMCQETWEVPVKGVEMIWIPDIPESEEEEPTQEIPE
jgi:uncharacterized Zn finger protein